MRAGTRLPRSKRSLGKQVKNFRHFASELITYLDNTDETFLHKEQETIQSLPATQRRGKARCWTAWVPNRARCRPRWWEPEILSYRDLSVDWLDMTVMPDEGGEIVLHTPSRNSRIPHASVGIPSHRCDFGGASITF